MVAVEVADEADAASVAAVESRMLKQHDKRRLWIEIVTNKQES